MFLSIHAAFYNHFYTRKHLISALEHHIKRDQEFLFWRDMTGV